MTDSFTDIFEAETAALKARAEKAEAQCDTAEIRCAELLTINYKLAEGRDKLRTQRDALAQALHKLVDQIEFGHASTGALFMVKGTFHAADFDEARKLLAALNVPQESKP